MPACLIYVMLPGAVLDQITEAAAEEEETRGF